MRRVAAVRTRHDVAAEAGGSPWTSMASGAAVRKPGADDEVDVDVSRSIAQHRALSFEPRELPLEQLPAAPDRAERIHRDDVRRCIGIGPRATVSKLLSTGRRSAAGKCLRLPYSAPCSCRPAVRPVVEAASINTPAQTSTGFIEDLLPASTYRCAIGSIRVADTFPPFHSLLLVSLCAPMRDGVKGSWLAPRGIGSKMRATFSGPMGDRPTTGTWQVASLGFSRLLQRLDPDPIGPQRHEKLREALERFFDWRGAWPPDECATRRSTGSR